MQTRMEGLWTDSYFLAIRGNINTLYIYIYTHIYRCIITYIYIYIYIYYYTLCRARISQFELFELVPLLESDKQLPVERFEATVSQRRRSEGGNHLSSTGVYRCIYIYIYVCVCIYIYIYAYIYIYNNNYLILSVQR